MSAGRQVAGRNWDNSEFFREILIEMGVEYIPLLRRFVKIYCDSFDTLEGLNSTRGFSPENLSIIEEVRKMEVIRRGKNDPIPRGCCFPIGTLGFRTRG
ncbi:MAG: hypothetical protein KAJ14_01010 [Candidatus Omnitrophica bacterium]|nr:hypothetical protein [Candidatus Omnitrophota bacterium]